MYEPESNPCLYLDTRKYNDVSIPHETNLFDLVVFPLNLDNALEPGSVRVYS